MMGRSSRRGGPFKPGFGLSGFKGDRVEILKYPHNEHRVVWATRRCYPGCVSIPTEGTLSMKKLSILGCFTAISIVLALPVFLSAQETRREIAPQATTEDARPNSDQIPDVYAIHGQVQRVVLLRFKYKADLLPGLQKMINQEKIRNAVILSGVGSVRSYQLHDVANGDFPTKDVVLKNPNGPANIVGMSGVVINGKVHAHIALANAD